MPVDCLVWMEVVLCRWKMSSVDEYDLFCGCNCSKLPVVWM